MGGNGPNNSSRVTTQQFYEALLDNKDEMKLAEDRQNEARIEMERRIMDELKGVPTQVETNTKEIDTLRKSSNMKDIAVAIGAAIGSGLAALIGSRQ